MSAHQHAPDFKEVVSSIDHCNRVDHWFSLQARYPYLTEAEINEIFSKLGQSDYFATVQRLTERHPVRIMREST